MKQLVKQLKYEVFHFMSVNNEQYLQCIRDRFEVFEMGHYKRIVNVSEVESHRYSGAGDSGRNTFQSEGRTKEVVGYN